MSIKAETAKMVVEESGPIARVAADLRIDDGTLGIWTTYIGLFRTCPSQTLTTMASMKITGYTRSNGRLNH